NIPDADDMPSVMPRRCAAARRVPCPFRARHWSLTGELGNGRLFGMCNKHFRFYGFMSRRWRRGDPEAPEIRTVRTNVPTLTGYLHRAQDIVYLTQVFAEQTTEYQLFGLAHETVHIVIRREFGLPTSLALDILYKRSLKCLRGHSMKTYELAALSAQSAPAKAPPVPVPAASGRRVMPRTLK